MNRTKLILFSLAPLILILVASELLWLVLGLGAPQREVSRGFDPGAAYLIPAPDLEGGWVTQMFERPRYEVHVPPKAEGVQRVLLFGGSNTQAFPALELQLELNRRQAPGQGRVEVINLGRKGYGSERVSILLEQALDRLNPDLVLVYSGHNEFVEMGFKHELEEKRSGLPSWASGALSRLRSFNLLTAAFTPAPQTGSSGEDTPEGWTDDTNRFLDTSYAETLEALERYRGHLERMAQAAEEHGVPLILSTLVTNHLSSPFPGSLPEELTDEQRRQLRGLLIEVDRAFPPRFEPLVRRSRAERPYLKDWWANREAPLQDGYRPPALRPLAPPLDGGWLGHPPAHWDPWLREFVAMLAAFGGKQFDAAERAALERCRELLDSIDAIHPELPDTLFRRAVVVWLLDGDDERAVELFKLAGDRECAPNKVNRLINAHVRAVAEQHDGILFDAARLFEDRSPLGLVGFEIMLDNCHLQPGAALQLMMDFADTVVPLLEDRR